MDKNHKSADHHVTDHFRKKFVFFLETRYNLEHDAKNRLSIPSPSSEEPMAEVESVKKKLTLAKRLNLSDSDTLHAENMR